MEEIKVDPISDAQSLFAEEMKSLEYVMTSAMEAVAPLDQPTIDEIMFREVFLPYFAGDEHPKYPNVTASHWLRISGNIFRTVDIINLQGEKILTVPPMLDREIIHLKDPLSISEDRPEGARGDRINHVWRTVTMLRQRSGVTAENYFLDAIQGRLVTSDAKEAILLHARRWNEIFEYYGREIPFPQLKALDEGQTLEKTETHTSTNKGVVDLSSLDYEDEMA